MNKIFNNVKALPLAVKQYLLITVNYWAFTLTDGALRMLVVLYFYQLGYQPLAIAMLFLFYEAFGVVTNLVGGWLGARIGLNKTMNIGLLIQICALLMLAIPHEYLSIFWVMFAQALSGIAKDLNKMSAKSSVKSLFINNENSGLFRWVSLLTGSKNALKGVGFFIGGVLLSWLGFTGSMFAMAGMLSIILLFSLYYLVSDLGKASYKPKFTQMFSTNKNLNYLSLARLFLFAARDVWFVVAIPIYFITEMGWEHEWVGAFMACWVIGYGIIQATTPRLLNVLQSIFTPNSNKKLYSDKTLYKAPKEKIHLSDQLSRWGSLLFIVTIGMFSALYFDFYTYQFVVFGLFVFGALFAINSSLHSYLIVAMAKNDAVSMDVGFYYMANAMGRLIGTVLSGIVYQYYGLLACLFISAFFIMLATLFIKKVEA